MLLALLATFAVSGCQDETRTYQKLSDTMMCGESTFTITSTCIAAAEPYALNECKAQELNVKSTSGIRTIALPDLPPATSESIRKSGRDPATMFVTEFGCTKAHGANVAVLYYSAGTSPGPRSEAWVEYQDNGSWRSDDQPRLTHEQRAALDAGMQHVRSIMPPDPVPPK